MKNTIQKRQQKEKQLLIEQIKKIPIIQVACEKTGIGRATYYRWRKEDEVFMHQADEALEEGSQFINDMAESQLLSSIRDNNMTAIIFWLKHHHKAYANRVEITTARKPDGPLTTEQEELLKKALDMTSLLPITTLIKTDDTQ